MIQSQYAREAEQMLHNKGKYTIEKKHLFCREWTHVEEFQYERKTHKKSYFITIFIWSIFLSFVQKTFQRI